MGMNYVLDTCAILSLSGIADRTVSPATLRDLAEADDLFVSPISLYEIGVKWKKGLLTLSLQPERYWNRCVKAYNLRSVPIEAPVLAKAFSLPDLHRDPFDRIIIAQAMLFSLPVVTFDVAFAPYGVQTLC